MNRKIVFTLCIYTLGFLAGSVMFAALFHTPLFGMMDVLFYRGILLLIVSSTTLTILLWQVTKPVRGWFTKKDIVIAVCIFFSFTMLFFTHIPVTAERSVSVFLLGYMQKQKTSVTREDLARAFLTQYIEKDKHIEKRIHEQLVTGDIQQQGDGYVLTKRGKIVLKIYTIVAGIFGIDNKLIEQR